MDEDEEKRLKEILGDIDKDIKLPPYNDNNSSHRRFSKRYQDYKKDEAESKRENSYEKLCYQMSSILGLKAEEKTQNKLNPAIKLLDWEITPGMVLSATIGVFALSFALWILGFILNEAVGAALGLESGLIPFSLMAILGLVPFMAGAYTFYKPIFDAKSKVIESSGEMILAVLYMVVYMRSSPNLEGAVRFAALNLEGPISKDLKKVLWSVEVGEFKRIDTALEDYTSRWKNYNKDFLESLNLLKAATNEPNPKRRERLLQDSIDNILDGTQEKMKHYAQSLETPVMILNAVGALLPVLGMIMLPLISAFLGGLITPLHLFIIFNLMLPTFLWMFMQRTLSSRPPTVQTQPVSEDSLPKRGYYEFNIKKRKYDLPVWPIGVVIALVISMYGIIGYLSFPYVYPVSDASLISEAPSMFVEGDDLAPFPLLLRSMTIVFGIGIGLGVTKILGNMKRQKSEENLREIESEFPNALFELGNKISGGTPIELALDQAAESTQDLEISDLFRLSSRNIKDMGMTFEDSIFDPDYGALTKFPSQMIKTVMKAILESSEKGTNMASSAMMTISRYLKNIHKTQEQLKDLMQDTTTTIQMLAYMLAPIVSGVAVGMSQTIITGLSELSQSFEVDDGAVPDGEEAAAGSGPAIGDGTMLQNLDSAIPPELLQLVVGIYLIQLLYILGTFYMKITRGEDQTYKNMFIGKIMISGMFFYMITVTIISLLFGGLMTGVAT